MSRHVTLRAAWHSIEKNDDILAGKGMAMHEEAIIGRA